MRSTHPSITKICTSSHAVRYKTGTKWNQKSSPNRRKIELKTWKIYEKLSKNRLLDPNVSKTSPKSQFFAFFRILHQFLSPKMEPESSKFRLKFSKKIKLFSRTIFYQILKDFTSKIESKITNFSYFFENVDLVKNLDFT